MDKITEFISQVPSKVILYHIILCLCFFSSVCGCNQTKIERAAGTSYRSLNIFINFVRAGNIVGCTSEKTTATDILGCDLQYGRFTGHNCESQCNNKKTYIEKQIDEHSSDEKLFAAERS